jgi:NAD(P)-dependent dehydrogenase (short-subunit alcohol dehydrogenase family)
MEERMPHLPQVTPDMVGSLKTLGQIGDFLASGLKAQPATDAALDDPSPSPNSGPAAVQHALLAVVAELTGYPEEMLGRDMDIEADLGIDSIKRVEILSAMEERMPHLPQVTPDMVGSLKTLGQIGDFLAAGSPADQQPPAMQPTVSTPVTATGRNAHPPDAIPRHIIDVVELPEKPGRTLQIQSGRWIGVLDDNTAMAQSIVSQLKKKHLQARRMDVNRVTDAASFCDAAGLIVCPGVVPEKAFLAAKHAAAELLEAAWAGDALLATISCMDGAFGFSGAGINDPEQGALAGLAKTAHLEWESVICQAVDLAPDFPDPGAAAQRVVAELTTVSPANPVEIGLSPQRRVALNPVPAMTVEGAIGLDHTDVVVVTGGARGVTAACARSLAEASGASIALIGRSEAPFDLPAWLNGIQGEANIKKAIIQHHFAGSRPTPRTVEKEYRRHTANAAIRDTLDRLARLGVRAAYFSADVTDSNHLEAALDAVRNRLGPITGLIHGAGVLHDRLIADKTIGQFRRVYDTKVKGFHNLMAATRSDRLRQLVLFSSVTARTGNFGQCDYAMANEALNKMARVESQNRSECRVTAINWGPWDGGMVTPSLKSAFNSRQIDLIPLETGADLMLAEMKNAQPGAIEVLIGNMLSASSTGEDGSDIPLTLLERRELDLHRYPVLASHIIGGKPVVPFALMTEWIGHGALKEYPGYALHGIDDLRLLNGIRIEQEKKLVRLMAGKAIKAGNAWRVDVELRNGVKNGKDVIHSRAKALLVDQFPEPPRYAGNGNSGSGTYPRNLDAIYGDILFHGDQLRAITAIDEYSDHGMIARLSSAPKPEVWMQDPIKERWMADPMVLDGAFQMAIVWSFEQTGNVCLPSYARAFRQYRPAFPASGVTAAMTVTAMTQRKMVADFTFIDAHRQVVATLKGYEAIVDESLMQAFKK